MKAIQFAKPGDELSLNEVPIPHPQQGQVVVKQRYTSINPMDHKIRLYHPFGTPLPATIGYDSYGTVTEIGEGVTRFKVGDEVFGNADIFGGGFAEYLVTSEYNLAKRTTIAPAEAGSSSIAMGTAWFALFTEENLSTFDLIKEAGKHKGQTIFIPGGGGGVGHSLIVLAKKSGYTVITSASKPESIKLSKDCGADHVIDYSKSDIVQEVLKLTHGKGVDVAVDTTVQASFVQSASVVRQGGKWIYVGSSWKDQQQAALDKCKERGVTPLMGDFGKYWTPAYKQQALVDVPHMLESLDKLYASGVHVRITKTIPFEIEKMREEVVAVGGTKRSGKVCVKIAGSD